MLRFLPNQSRPSHPTTSAAASPNTTPTTDSRLIRRQSTHDRAAISPFDRLPLELHAEIFSHALPAFPHLDDKDEAPMVIARVCGTWRSLVLSTPKLWASFEIEVQDTLDGESPNELLNPDTVRLLHSVQVWLERSRNHPLSVRLVHMPTTRVPNSLSVQLLAMLAAHTRRWRHVEFVVPSTCLSESRGLFTEEFPSLKHLKIHMKGQWDGGAGEVNSLLAMNIPWRQLTTVDLRLDHAHLLNLDEFAGLLKDATNLVSCSFNANCIMSAESARKSNPIQDRLRLPALEKLHLVLQGGSPPGLGFPNPQLQLPSTVQSPFLQPEQSLTAFLSLFADCKLTHLHLDWLVDSSSTARAAGSRWEAPPSSSFRSLLSTLSPTLHSLRLAYLPLGEDELLQSLAQLSNAGKVTELDLRFPIADHEHDPITDRFLKSLTRPSAPAGAQAPAEKRRNAVVQGEVPAQLLGFEGLKKLNVHCSGERCNQKFISDLIDSRRDGAMQGTEVPSLTEVSFYSMYPVMLDASRHIDAWAKAGIDVQFESVVAL